MVPAGSLRVRMISLVVPILNKMDPAHAVVTYLFRINNSVQFFIIYVPSQQLQGQLQTLHSVDTSNYIVGRHNKKSKKNYSKHWRKTH
jgi:hypothetical protein